MKIKSRALSIPLILTLLISVGVMNSSAQPTPTVSGRFKIVHIQVTEYTWQLLALSDNHAICEVTVEHSGQPTNDELLTACYQVIFPLAPTLPATQAATSTVTPTSGPTQAPTPLPFDFPGFLKKVYWHLKSTARIDKEVQVPLPDMGLNIIAPDKPVVTAYVILTAYEPVPAYHITAIHGQVNFINFVCPQARCEVPLQGDSVIEFWATSSSGDDSIHIQATVRVTSSNNKFVVEIVKSGPFTSFTDACSQEWGLNPNATWATFPQSPDQLATDTTLYFLASRLINTKIVDASSCPGGGLFSDGSANACGIDTARAQMIQWQNQFDPVIWAAGRDVGIPPRMLKALVQAESQFWPGNTRFLLIEYGLGQLTLQGADVALRWDPELYQEICSGLLYDCTVAYANLDPTTQMTIAGTLLQMVNADCPNCVGNVDLANASDSLPVLARTLRANCSQVESILTPAGVATSNYDDMWRFTLVSYHNGYQCLSDAITAAKNKNEPFDWEHVSAYMTCPAAVKYVDDVWGSLQVNTTAPYSTAVPDAPTLVPTFFPTSTPTSAPTPILSTGTLVVQVYIDYNHDNQIQTNELVNGVNINVTFSDGTVMSQATANGTTTFNLAGKVTGLGGTVSVPSLFRSETFAVPVSGQVQRVFKIEPPVLPTALP